MPAISGRKICRQFRVGKYAGNFGSEDMPAISGRKKMPAKSDRNKMLANLGRKKMPVFSGGDKIAGELTGL